MNREEELNIEILELNKELLINNKRVSAENEAMNKKEHQKKMELFDYQKQGILMELTKDIEPKALHSVAEFHKQFGAPIFNIPTLPSIERAALRVELIREELEELETAFMTNDIVEVADALADLQYVLSGAIHECGMGGIFKELFDEVHRSNMSKACNSIEEAEATVAKYKKAEVETNILTKDDKFLVLRFPDRKVLKSINYSPAALESIVLK